MNRSFTRTILMLALLCAMLLPAYAMAAVATVGGTEYDTLAAAVAAANVSGGTVTLTSDVTLTEKLTISKDVEITGKYTITRDASYTGTLFHVAKGGSLTLDGGLTIDGNNNWSFDKSTYETDLNNMTSVPKADAAKYFTPETGKPVPTATMITMEGGNETSYAEVNLNDVTIQNHYSMGKGIVLAAAYSKVTLDGAKITHCANVTGSGLAVDASGAGIEVKMEDGTVIDGNHVGGNHGVFKIYSGTVFTMSGGEIKNTTGCNSNGVAVGVYNATFNMNGGSICGNSSVYGSSNGRNAAVYLHSNSTMNMTGGEICHNKGRSRGGIDCSYTTGVLKITGKDAKVVDNISIGGNRTCDVGGTTVGFEITAGTYTQDVTPYIPEGKNLIAFDNGDGTWTVLEGYAITYELNGGEVEGNPEKYATGKEFSLNDPTKDGAVFLGWTGDNGTEPQTGLTMTMPKKALSFTANWANICTITYELDGGEVTGNPETYVEGETVTLNNPTRAGYTFLGWTGSNGETPQTDLSVTLTGNLTFTANWEVIPTPEPTAEPTPEPTAEPTPEPTAEPTVEPTAEPTPDPDVDNLPKTGDESMLAIWVLLFGCAGGALMLRRKQEG